MKKSLIALAALAAFGTASAQSTATISGTLGAAHQSFENPAQAIGTACSTAGQACSAGANAAVTKANNRGAAMTDSSVRVAVSEDLGGGLKASAYVQFAQPHVLSGASRGTAVTKEDSSVALGGDFGTVSITNTRSSNTAIGANVFATSLPYTTFYGSSSGAGVASRANGDLLAYSAPAISGVTLGLSQFESTEGTSTSAGKVNIISANYAQGPLAIAFSSKSKNEALVTTTNMRTETELAATYDFGVAKVGLGYGSKTARTGDALVAWGISVPVGAMTFGVNGADRGTAKFIEGGAKYALSKRTTLNVMFGTYDMNAVAATTATTTKVGAGAIDAIKGGNQSRFGLVHTF